MKPILIFGATGYLGQHLSFALAQAGFDLVLQGRHEKRLDALANQIFEKTGKNPDILPLDFNKASYELYTTLAQSLEEAYPQITGMVFLAGSHPGFTPLHLLSAQQYQQIQACKVHGPQLILQYLWPLVLRSDGCQIIQCHEDWQGNGIQLGGSLRLSELQAEVLWQQWALENQHQPQIEFVTLKYAGIDTPSRRRQFPGLDNQAWLKLEDFIQPIMRRFMSSTEGAV